MFLDEIGELSLPAQAALLRPGNIRQLENVVKRATVVCESMTIQLEHLPAQVWIEQPVTVVGLQGAAGESEFRSLTDRVREFEIELIREALQRAHGNQSQAARILVFLEELWLAKRKPMS